VSDTRPPSSGERPRPRSHARRPTPRPAGPRTSRRFRQLRALVLLVLLIAGIAGLAVASLRGAPKQPSGSAGAKPKDSGLAMTAAVLPTATPVADPAALRKQITDTILVLESREDGIKIATFLGNSSRNFYGVGPVPQKLDVIWRYRLGSGKTSGTASSKGPVTWSGSGWTGQVTMVQEGGKRYVLASGYDHGLRRIDADTGEQVWRYEFPDVIKGTNTVIVNPKPTSADDKYLVICGSRRGFGVAMGAAGVAPVRCVTFGSGREVWRLPSPRTKAYSQDADSSGLLVNGSYYQAIEAGYIYRLDPNSTSPWSGFQRPKELASALLYEASDSAKHGGNLLPEGSPTLVGDRLFIASGAGHVYGLSVPDLKKVWDFKTGSDLDSSPALTKTGKLVLGVEKQYISGKGGAMMLDPAKPPAQSVMWYFPTGDRKFGDWLGGIIGSISVNDSYDPDGTRPALAAFTAIDGNLYLVSQDQLAPGKVKGFDGVTDYPTPVLVAKKNIGGAISTPIIVDDNIIAAGYGATVQVFKIRYDDPKGVELTARNGAKVRVGIGEVASFKAGAFESTPIVWRGRIYIGSRDGYLYCLGEK
jgi:outer membrane protein assembly factor BamB